MMTGAPRVGDVIATNRHGTKRYLAVCTSCGFGFAPTCATDDECGCWPEALDAMDERAAEAQVTRAEALEAT